LSWTKLDPRFCSIDAGVVMTVYVPVTSDSFRFEISEDEMRSYAERDRLMNGVSYKEGERSKRASLLEEDPYDPLIRFAPSSLGAVMDIKNLMKLKMRLKCRMNRLKRPQFKYSRMAQSERGLQMLSSGFNIQHIAIDRKKNGLVVMKGRLYICTAFKSSDAISFSAYDPKTSKFLRASVPNHLLHKWLVREELSKVSEGRGGGRRAHY